MSGRREYGYNLRPLCARVSSAATGALSAAPSARQGPFHVAKSSSLFTLREKRSRGESPTKCSAICSENPPRTQASSYSNVGKCSGRFQRRLSKGTTVSSAESLKASSSDVSTSPDGHASTSSSCNTNDSNGAAKVDTRRPMSPREVLNSRRMRARLTAYEQVEILQYPQVYFIGAELSRKLPAAPSISRGVGSVPSIGRAPAFGGYSSGNQPSFDDKCGSYVIVPRDHIAYRYEVDQLIGKGAFGQVVRAFDYGLGRHVAVKLIRNEPRYHKQALIEIDILQTLARGALPAGLEQHNIVHMLAHFTFRSHKCIVFELLGQNLYEVIKRNKFVGFSLPLVRKFTRSIIQAVRFLHEQRVVHADLKPENILLKQDADGKGRVVVIDFGSACYVGKTTYTYIQSRFYRAPEVMLGAPYGRPVDMWSLGCIAAELYRGVPILPGENEADQLARSVEMLGTPPLRILASGKRSSNFFMTNGQPKYCAHGATSGNGFSQLSSKSKRSRPRGPPKSRPLSAVLPRKSTSCTERDFALFVDFVTCCLAWDQDLRITPHDALHHPWLEGGSQNGTPISLQRYAMNPVATHKQAVKLPKI